MTLGSREAHVPEWRPPPAAPGRGNGFPGGMGAALGGLIALVVIAAIVGLDYGLGQPVHRVIKLVLAAVLGVGVLLKPWVGLLFFPILAPFLPWIPPVPVPGINALNLLLGVVFVTWALGRAASRRSVFRPARLGSAILWLLAVAALSVVRGAAFPTGYEYDAGGAWVELFRSVVTLCVYFVALSMAQGERDRRWLAWAIVLGLLAEAAVTVAYGRIGRGARAEGSIGQSNDLGAFLALYVVFATALLPAVRNWCGRIVLAAALTLGIYATVLSVSRAAIVALALGLFYVAIRSSRALTFLLVAVAITSPWWAPDYLKERMTGTQAGVEGTDEVGFERSAQIRMDTWRAIVRLVSDHPLDGVGFTGLQSVLPEAGDELGVEVKDSAHNTFLRALGEMGILGLFLFCALLWNCWALGRDAARAARNRFDRQLGVGVCAATLVLAVSCAFGDRFFNPIVTGGFWVACALANDVLLECRETPA